MNKNNILNRSYEVKENILKKVTPDNFNKNKYSNFFSLDNNMTNSVKFSKTNNNIINK